MTRDFSYCMEDSAEVGWTGALDTEAKAAVLNCILQGIGKQSVYDSGISR